MATANSANPESLEVLTSMLNQTLIETGRFFRSGGSLQSRAQLKRAIPAAHEQFQCALDNLSEQIFIAKAFLERDYEVIKAKKAASRHVEDVVMEEAETKVPETVAAPEQATEAVPSESQQRQVDNSNALPQQPAANQNRQENFSVPVKEENPPDETGAHPQAVMGTEEINFDSMLNTQGANEFDLNLDFGDNTDTGNENFLSGSNFGNLGTGAGMEGENMAENAASGQNMQTGGDAFDLELQKAEVFSANPDGQFGANMEDIMPGESSFDDLFMENENMGGDGVLDGDGLMQINELDDNWFT
ncbi:hypothetical protein P175DRAFT_0491127 [Aspergillus ochraceoroseus IBT 24754]|uniref:Uncharacterized protein n=3 Tax=Aspergillus subgen. Nidulantes TaxID=2720870 RepID=A0A0F8UNB9_9EURO|nr:uncharacterized protein P175DRAFT_0491127 [Aspergillus ochraceoroseus IBT 24754]KKK20758.1 hypothetical protein AOCH_007198 [Aspergillus ochraceoroseus]KKK21114.1 hypothetical protein ARAM_007405 [Aspergillus rambellii]PTU22694.1 hypothetical protein P175DRAFT_0491127 [Aspergillus ochraceoroseus IBT 24754]